MSTWTDFYRDSMESSADIGGEVDYDAVEVQVFDSLNEAFSKNRTLYTVIDRMTARGSAGESTFVEHFSDIDMDSAIDALNQIALDIGASQATVDDMFSEDEDIAIAHYDSVAEMLNEFIGDGSLEEYVTYLTSADFDDAFYANMSQCKLGKGEKKFPKGDNIECKKGFHKGKDVVWRRPKKGATHKTETSNRGNKKPRSAEQRGYISMSLEKYWGSSSGKKVKAKLAKAKAKRIQSKEKSKSKIQQSRSV